MNTGGHVYCRIWKHKTDNVETVYNMLDNTIGIIGAKYNSESGKYEGDLGKVIDKRRASDDCDESELVSLAKEMMEDYNK
jgi:RNA binding exosome subunit